MAKATYQTTEVSVTDVYPNPNQPRKTFTPESLTELGASIQANGLMQPITVVPRKSASGKYMIVGGERRWRASCQAGLPTIQAIIRADLNDKQVAELALIENLNREDLQPLEEARAYERMLDNGHDIASLQKVLGYKSARKIEDRLSLLNLDHKFQDALSKGILNIGQAFELSILNVENQFRLWTAIQDGRADTSVKLRRLSQIFLDEENQINMFQDEPQTDAQRKALGKVDQFINRSGALLGMITTDDLSVIESVLKSDAPACIAKLDLLMTVCKQVRNALEQNVQQQAARSAA
jgi:ParB family chromosome partitioning protein